LIGPSGCGKSTILRLMMGLAAPTTGRVLIRGIELIPDNVLDLRRLIGYVIQDGGLFPHLTGEGNVALLMRYLGFPEERIGARIAELAALVQLPLDTLDRYPAELSGGQRQRVALMRALMLDPPFLLLDEPLGALDPITRNELQAELKEIFAGLSKTVALVSHDMGEAAYLADQIVLMKAGRIVQIGSLKELLQHPVNPWVTDFIRAQRSPLDEQWEAAQ
jgi:osmoprotectant transport system ATP-binding protein